MQVPPLLRDFPLAGMGRFRCGEPVNLFVQATPFRRDLGLFGYQGRQFFAISLQFGLVHDPCIGSDYPRPKTLAP